MKKLISILCFFFFTISYQAAGVQGHQEYGSLASCCEETDTDTYELELEQEESDEKKTELHSSQPIEIKIFVTNTHIERTNNKTEVCQKQEIVKELQEKKQHNSAEVLYLAQKIALAALILSDPYQTRSIFSLLWKFIW